MTDHEKHLDILLRTIFAGDGGSGGTPTPGPEPTPEPTPEVVEKDVTFYDWDGTPLYSYTAAEALALEALPEIPDRSSLDLVHGEWNWSLDEIKTCVTACGICCVGANYYTVGGKTFIDIVPDETKTFKITLYGGGTVDWGDGHSDTVASGAVQHTYTDTQPHTITFPTQSLSFVVDPMGDRMIRRVRGGWGGTSSLPGSIYPTISGYNLEAVNLQPGAILSKISFGENYLNPAPKLKFLAIPRGVAAPRFVGLAGWGVPGGVKVSHNYNAWSSPTNALLATAALNGFWNITPPNSNTPSSMFSIASGARLAKMTGVALAASRYKAQGIDLRINENAQTIPPEIGIRRLTFGSAAQMIYMQDSARLEDCDIYVPETMTYFRLDGTSQYMPLWRARSIHLKSETPPTVVGANTSQKTCRIYVPAAAVETYKAATGWSYYSDYIFPEAEVW